LNAERTRKERLEDQQALALKSEAYAAYLTFEEWTQIFGTFFVSGSSPFPVKASPSCEHLFRTIESEQCVAADAVCVVLAARDVSLVLF